MEEGRAQTTSQVRREGLSQHLGLWGASLHHSRGPETPGMSESLRVLEWGGRRMLDMPFLGPAQIPATGVGAGSVFLTTPFVPGGSGAKLGDHFRETRSAASCPFLCLVSEHLC